MAAALEGDERRGRGANLGSEGAWVILTFALLGMCILPLFVLHVDLNNLKSGTSPPVLAIVGVLLSAYTPSLAAIMVTAVWKPRLGVRRLLAQMLHWRVHPGWYVLVLAGPIVLFLLADALHIARGGAAPHDWVLLPDSGSLSFVFGGLIAGALGEEFGWRGFGQSRLQLRYGALVAAIFIGIVWSTWHLWPAIVPGGHMAWSDVVATYVRLISTAVLYAWIYNSTNNTLLVVMVAHIGHNIASALVQIPMDGSQDIPMIVALLYLAAAIVVVLLTRSRTLTRTKPEAATSAPG